MLYQSIGVYYSGCLAARASRSEFDPISRPGVGRPVSDFETEALVDEDKACQPCAIVPPHGESNMIKQSFVPARSLARPGWRASV